MAASNESLKYSGAKDVDELRKKMEKLSTGGSASFPQGERLYSHFTPGCHLITFEGGVTEGDLVEFSRYNGEKQPHHGRRRAYEPALSTSSHEAAASFKEGKNEQIILKFIEQINLINLAYKEEEHGKMKVVARYGKLYYIDDPPKRTMTTAELSEYGIRGKQRIGKPFRSAFIPQDLPHAPLEAYLKKEGYELVTTESKFMIDMKIGGGSTECMVVQNENLEFVEFRYPDFKWVIFNVKRAESKRRDVRFTVQSVRDSVEASDPVVKRYASAEIIALVDENLSVKKEFVKEVDFVRRKITRKFKKQGAKADGEFQSEVHLARTKEYGKPSGLGSFSDVKQWRDEVVIQPDVPDTQDEEACSKFMKEFIKFCFNIEAIAK